MDKLLQNLTDHWGLIALIVFLVLVLFIAPLRNAFLQTFFGIVFVPEDSIGLQTKKFVLFGANKSLPEGRIIASQGEAGFQAQTLPPGLHWGKWKWQYEITMQKLITIEGGKLGLIKARDGMDLPNGQILARSVNCENFQDAVKFMNNGGFKGNQTQFLSPGTYRINTLLFDVSTTAAIKVADNMVGIVTTNDGTPLPVDQIAGAAITAQHNKFQNADVFLNNQGSRGLQSEVILSGLYYINPWFASIELVEMTTVGIGNVGVVVSYFGKEGVDVSGDTFKHGNIFNKGDKGVWAEPLQPGKYAINTKIAKVEMVPTTNLVLNWADSRNESHQLDKNLCTIKVRSKDGFTFNLDVSQIIHVPMNDAPKVIARFGNMQNLVNQVLEPTIGNYFRNSAQDSDVISFLNTRKERQDAAKEVIGKVLEDYNVHAVDTLIGDIVPPADLMKTLTDRKIAQEQDATYKQKIITETTRKDLERNSSLADMQKDIVKAEQGVAIAEKVADANVKKATGEKEAAILMADGNKYRVEKEADATAYRLEKEGEAEGKKITSIGTAEAGKIEAIGKATAVGYKEQVDSVGQDNFAKMKIVETLGINKTQLVPQVLVAGGSGNGGAIEGLLGMKLLENIGETLTTPVVLAKKKEEPKKKDEESK